MSKTRKREASAPVPHEELEFRAMPGHLIRRMQQVSTAIFDAEITRSGIDLTPVQFAALTTIARHPGLDQATLASAIAYDRVTIGGVVDRLEHKGFVRREIAPEDRRARRLYAEPSGIAVLNEVRPFVLAVQDKIMAGLSEEEAASLVNLLSKALDTVGDLSRAPMRPVPES